LNELNEARLALILVYLIPITIAACSSTAEDKEEPIWGDCKEWVDGVTDDAWTTKYVSEPEWMLERQRTASALMRDCLNGTINIPVEDPRDDSDRDWY
jgi:hypothetical protein